MLPTLDNPFADATVLAYGVALAGLMADHVLVACRLLGLLATVPGCCPSAVPWHLRGVLLVVLTAVITPNVSLSADEALHPADREFAASKNAEGPIRRTAHVASSRDDQLQFNPTSASRFRSLSKGLDLGSIADFIGLAICEVGLGVLLGVGANLVLQGFRMAGQLIDQQTGWGLVASSAVDGDDGGSITGEMYFWIGTALLFVLGGHLLLISTLMDTFRAFPPGHAVAGEGLHTVAGQLLQQSCSVALSLSAPILAVHVLVGLILSHAGSVAPSYQNAGTSVILRAILGLGVLLLALTGTTDRLIELIPGTLERLLSVF